jgi:20S proteasome alpha/beta subunit
MKHNNYYKYGIKNKDMTYILGAQCSDGVVLIADTKVTIDDGADFAYTKKLSSPLNNVVMGASGIGGLYKDFQNRIINSTRKIDFEKRQQGISLNPSEEEFSVLVNNVIRDMHRDYEDDRHLIINNLMIIGATRISSGKAQITTYNPYGFPEPVNNYRAIGHGEPYGAIFLKKMWNVNMSMEQTAKLGLFIIKFIQDMKLDNSVGFTQDYLPQVVYIPDVKVPADFGPAKFTSDEIYQEEVDKLFNQYPLRELSIEEVNSMVNEISSKISDFENYFKKGDLKI